MLKFICFFVALLIPVLSSLILGHWGQALGQLALEGVSTVLLMTILLAPIGILVVIITRAWGVATVAMHDRVPRQPKNSRISGYRD